MRGSAEEALAIGRGLVMRGVIVCANDSTKMQEVNVRLYHNEVHTDIERPGVYGHTSVPLPMDKDGKGAEAVVLFIGGDRSQGIVVQYDDRRHRPKNLKPGESATFDDQGQVLKIARDGYEAVAKKLSLTAGDKPETDQFEMNEQLKGLAARVAQNEHLTHATFNGLSRLRELTQIRVPEVAALAGILNKEVSGLEAMLNDLSPEKAETFLQKTFEKALVKFLSPNLAGLASVLGAGVESTIAGLKAQIADLITKNPVVKTVDQLRAELDALTTSGAAQSVIQAGIARLQPQIASLLGSNSAVGTVDGLRAQLASAVASAGPGLNFLEPQKRLVQGLTRSMQLGG